jgi:hypothetical protein
MQVGGLRGFEMIVCAEGVACEEFVGEDEFRPVLLRRRFCDDFLVEGWEMGFQDLHRPCVEEMRLRVIGQCRRFFDDHVRNAERGEER